MQQPAVTCESPQTSATNQDRQTRGTIVVADDDPETLMLLCQVLDRSHFTVFACENGQIACEAVRREKPDVVLIDWMMPVMDGQRAVEDLKADPQTRGIPIIMLTSQLDISERVIALEAGVQDFLTKPVDARELVARIDQQMRWRKMLAVDANEAFVHDRLKLYRPDDVSEKGAPTIFDRIWSTNDDKSKKRRR